MISTSLVNSMAMPLQIALFLASIAIVIFVAFCLPAVLQMRQHAERMAQTLAELKAEVSLLVQDSRINRNLNDGIDGYSSSVTTLSA